MPYADGIEKNMLNADGILKTRHNDQYNIDIWYASTDRLPKPLAFEIRQSNFPKMHIFIEI